MSTTTGTDASSAPGSVAQHDRPTFLSGRALRITAISATTALATYVLLDSGLLPGYLGLLPLVAILALVPSHRLLVRRLSLNLALFLGWTPMVWWVDWPVDVNHGAGFVATGSAVVVASRLCGVVIRPVASPPELLIVLGAPLVASAAVWRWMSSSTPQDALEQLVPGFDNWAHFGMFWSMRRYGAVLDTVGPSPDGTDWAYGRYPMGFHSVVGSISEILSPGLADGTQALPAYLHAQAVTVVLGVLLVTATVMSLQGLRRRPMVALPTVAIATSALVWEPGQKIFADGFTSFWLASVASGVALLIAIARRRPQLVEVAAVSGLILLASHCWLPLAALALPAGLLVLIPYVGDGRSWRRDAMVALLLAVGAIGSLKAVLTVLTTVTVSFVVDENGGYNAPALLPVLVLVLAGGLVLVTLTSAQYRREAEPPLLLMRQRVLLGVPLVIGLVALLALFVAQVQRNGTTSYYFIKLLLGYELVLVVLVPALIAMWVAARFAPGGRRRRRIATSVALSLLATVAFGVERPSQAKLFDTDAPGTASFVAPYSREQMAAGVLAAAAMSGERDSFEMTYVALGQGNAGLLLYPDAWFHAVHSSMSSRVLVREEAMRRRVSTPVEAASVVTQMLTADPSLVFLVPEEAADKLRDELPARLAAHIVTIPAPGT